MRYAILLLSTIALLAGCASSQQARVEPASPVVVTLPVPVSPPVTETPVSFASASPTASPSASVTPTATISRAVDPRYYNADDVDVHQHPLNEVLPNYPAEADRLGLSGKVVLQIKLETDGRVSEVRVLSATPPGVFDESALQAFRQARFSPAQKNGRPVRALVQIEVVYDWEGRPH